MDALREICDENNIYLIEDCCQAILPLNIKIRWLEV